MRSIRKWLADHWQIEALDIQAVGPVWRVSAADGDWCVKFGKHGLKKLLFHHHAIEALWRNGFDGTPRLRPNLSGAPFTKLPEGELTVSAWVGRPLDATSRREWTAAAGQLARFHQASLGLQVPDDVKTASFSGKWLRRLPERTQELEAAMRSFHLPQNEFEAAVVRDGEPILLAARKASATLQDSAYARMVDDLAETPALVHGNVKGENFAVDESGRVSLIDFDSFRVDVPVQDLADLLTHVFQSLGYSLPAAETVFKAYHEVRPISRSEADVLMALLGYPYAAQKVVHKYVSEGRTVEKALRKWNRAVTEWQAFEDFLEKWAFRLDSCID